MEYEKASIQSALQIFDQTPHGIWWKDLELTYRLMNQTTATMLGYKSSAVSFEGITDYDLSCGASELADEFSEQDRYVIRTKKQLSMICFCKYAHNEWKVVMGHKFPRLNASNEVIGMSGSSIDITHCSVMRTALLLLSDDEKLIGCKLNNLNQFTYMLKNTYDDFNLTRRESECLFLLIRGKTMKEIANSLKIGNRAVEKYIENIKSKMNCYRRSELVQKALQQGAGSIIPKSIFEPQRREVAEIDHYDVIIHTCDDLTMLPRMTGVDVSRKFRIAWVGEDKWYISFHAYNGEIYEDYLENLPIVFEVAEILNNIKPTDITESLKDQIKEAVVRI